MTETAENPIKPQTQTAATTEDASQHKANTVADNSVANNQHLLNQQKFKHKS